MKYEKFDVRFAELTSRSRQFARANMWPFMRRSPIFAMAAVLSLLSAVYWLVIAPDRYVSEAHVIVQRTELTKGMGVDLSSLLVGASSENRSDQLILRDYLRSTDLVRKLDRELHLRGHYSAWHFDPLSRLKSDATIEELHEYYLSHVSIEFDDYTGVLVIKAEGFDPETAQAITRALVREGENFMNGMAHALAKDQVDFLESEVERTSQRAMKARQAVLDYQNRNGLVSPEIATEAISGIIANLEGKRTELQARLAALQSYLVPGHPNIVELQQQIDAISQQIQDENARLVSPQGGKLNSKIEQFQRLTLEAKFAEDLYKTALAALEKGRVEATRTVKKMSIVQAPNLPEEAGEPRRLYETAVYIIVIMLASGVVYLLSAIIRDHRD